MQVRRAALSSISAHALVLAGVVAWRTHHSSAAPVAESSQLIEISIAAPAPAPAPFEVAIAPPSLPAAPPAVASAVRPRLSRSETVPSSPAAGGSAITTITAPPVETPGAASTTSGVLRMRGTELHPTDEALAPIANATPPSPSSAEPAPSGKLIQNGDEWVATDNVVAMRIKSDGNVAFKREHDFNAHWALPIPSPTKLGNMIADWYADPYAQTRARRVQDLSKVDQAVDGGWDSGAGGDGEPDGKARERRPASSGGGVPIVGGSFDLTAWAMRKAHVGDPYGSNKRALISTTYDERVAISARYRTRQLTRSPELMRRNLVGLTRRALSPAELRAELFALWDECVEDDGAAGEAGQRARALVIGWIHAHLPSDGPDAFTTDEIARLDAQRGSIQHFAPY